MSDNGEIIKEDNGWRVRLVTEEYPDEPYDDGQSPLLRIDRGYAYSNRSAEHVMATGRPTGDDSRIEEAAVRWAGEPVKLEKYLRAYYGATQVVWYGPNQSTDYTYVTYDTAAWREYAGMSLPLPENAVSLNEYRAYLEGHVYYYVVEQKVTWRAVNPVSDDPDYAEYPDRESWEETDSCGGYYGYEYARQCALEAFEAARTA
jgi:hypothetical protein